MSRNKDTYRLWQHANGTFYILWTERTETSPGEFCSRSKRVSTWTTDRKAAEQYRAQFIAELNNPSPPPEPTLGYLLDRYRNEHGVNTRSLNTIDYQMKTLKPFFGDLLPCHVSNTLLKQYAMDRGVSDGTILRELGTLKAALEEKYGYANGEHQRVIVEHVRDGRQHFHVIWNRVSLATGKPHYPYMHKKQSKIAARELEAELGLKKPVSRFSRTAHRLGVNGRYAALHAEIDAPQITIRRKRKGGKGDSGVLGSGGGAGSAMSAFVFHSPASERKNTQQPLRPLVAAKARKAYWGGPNRRFKYVPVPVERREGWVIRL